MRNGSIAKCATVSVCPKNFQNTAIYNPKKGGLPLSMPAGAIRPEKLVSRNHCAYRELRLMQSPKKGKFLENRTTRR